MRLGLSLYSISKESTEVATLSPPHMQPGPRLLCLLSSRQYLEECGAHGDLFGHAWCSRRARIMARGCIAFSCDREEAGSPVDWFRV